MAPRIPNGPLGHILDAGESHECVRDVCADALDVVPPALVFGHFLQLVKGKFHLLSAHVAVKADCVLEHVVPVIPCRVVVDIVGQELVDKVKASFCGRDEEIKALHSPVPMLPAVVVLGILPKDLLGEVEFVCAVAKDVENGPAMVPHLVIFDIVHNHLRHKPKFFVEIVVELAEQLAAVLPRRVIGGVQVNHICCQLERSF
mmetsp:Transcript_15462/g.39997  ORF Transcript_15462/g.39997 Transcript_15462/m.39997 type:complete len:202 (-) Transcript_15462:259-864(-)